MGYLDNTKDNLRDSELESMRDEEVLALSVTSPRHFEALVNKYQEPFLRNARKVLGTREEAIDVVQETFTKIYVNANKFKEVEGARFSSWAYKILFNTAFTYYKKTKRKEGFFAQIDDEIWALLPDRNTESFEDKSVRDYVASVISRMPEPLARVLSMHYIDDKPQKEIAEELGVSLPAVKTRIHRAKKVFKDINLSLIV